MNVHAPTVGSLWICQCLSVGFHVAGRDRSHASGTHSSIKPGDLILVTEVDLKDSYVIFQAFDNNHILEIPLYYWPGLYHPIDEHAKIV